MREIYVYRDGQLVPKHSAPAKVQPRNAPNVISDVMRPMVHPVNGEFYDSKSRFRAETRSRGLTEVGNERMKDTRRLDLPPIKGDIARAIEELS